jgi:hypothetical protein
MADEKLEEKYRRATTVDSVLLGAAFGIVLGVLLGFVL